MHFHFHFTESTIARELTLIYALRGNKQVVCLLMTVQKLSLQGNNQLYSASDHMHMLDSSSSEGYDYTLIRKFLIYEYNN